MLGVFAEVDVLDSSDWNLVNAMIDIPVIRSDTDFDATRFHLSLESGTVMVSCRVAKRNSVAVFPWDSTAKSLDPTYPTHILLGL